jgi:hypothetical protein
MSVNPSDLMRESKSRKRRTTRYDNPDDRSPNGGRSDNGSLPAAPTRPANPSHAHNMGAGPAARFIPWGARGMAPRRSRIPPGLKPPARPMREAELCAE